MAGYYHRLACAAFLLSVTNHAVVHGWINRPVTTTTRTSLQLSSSSSSSNVVLRPSEDPTAFDSYKLGNARVHRYSRDSDPDSEIEYVMWYHGRSSAMHKQDTTLAPLSTGRIGRARSKNGLVWSKDLAGSASEDAVDVSLGLNTESWWGFDTSHVGLGNVLLPMSTPAVLTEGGVYLMYYMGGSAEETLAGDYIDKELPESMKDVKVRGMKMKIGVAVSQDGISWGRVEGDDPSGACMVPYDKQDPNVQKENIPANMPEELYCAWPEVVINLDGNPDESFLMYYSTMTKQDKKKCIGYAISPDGFRWYKQGMCIVPDVGSIDASGCARCCVLRDAVYDNGSWKELSSWKMYYEGVSPTDNKHRIIEAKSADGKEWEKVGVALNVGSADSWDCGGVGAPHVVRMDDGTLRMYYTGQGADGSTAIGVAKLVSNENTMQWVREQASFSLA